MKRQDAASTLGARAWEPALLSFLIAPAAPTPPRFEAGTRAWEPALLSLGKVDVCLALRIDMHRQYLGVRVFMRPGRGLKRTAPLNVPNPQSAFGGRVRNFTRRRRAAIRNLLRRTAPPGPLRLR